MYPIFTALLIGLWAGAGLVNVLEQEQFRKAIMILTTMGDLIIFESRQK